MHLLASQFRLARSPNALDLKMFDWIRKTTHEAVTSLPTHVDRGANNQNRCDRPSSNREQADLELNLVVATNRPVGPTQILGVSVCVAYVSNKET